MLADDTITVTRQPREKPFSFFSFLSPPPFSRPFSLDRELNVEGRRVFFVFEIFQDRFLGHTEED